MQFTINVRHLVDPAVERRLEDIESALEHIIERLEKMALNFAPLNDAITENNTVVQGVVTLLEGVAKGMENNAADTAKIIELAAQVRAQKEALGAAVAANTAAATEAPPAA